MAPSADDDRDDPRPIRLPDSPWLYLALSIVALALAGLAAWFLFLRTVEKVPSAVSEEGRQLVRELERVAAAFNQGTVTHLFVSYATALEGTAYLQVATLEQTEVFELRDEASTLWGTIDLPDVTVRATAPVTYTYYVDLNDRWRFELRGREVLVVAPDLRYNKPAIDASRIEYEVRQGSVLRDEKIALDQLKRELTGRSAIRARESVSLVEDTARLQIAAFVRAWFLQSFADAGSYSLRVVFADELEAEEAAPEPLVIEGLDEPG